MGCNIKFSLRWEGGQDWAALEECEEAQEGGVTPEQIPQPQRGGEGETPSHQEAPSTSLSRRDP